MHALELESEGWYYQQKQDGAIEDTFTAMK